ncbi:MAG: hypothetical protein AAFY56_13635 [Pseudomonadota bacterium]
MDCTVEVENSFDSLFTHVALPDDVTVEPGDEVQVLGNPIDVPFGENALFERRATVIRARPIERLWTRLTGDLEFMELLEFSFSSARKL